MSNKAIIDATRRLVMNNDFKVVTDHLRAELADVLLATDPTNLTALQTTALRYEALVVLVEQVKQLAEGDRNG